MIARSSPPICNRYMKHRSTINRCIRTALVTAIFLPAGMLLVVQAAEPAPQVDEIALQQAKSQFERGNLVDSERFFRSALDANKLPASELGPCLERLRTIYLAWGQNDDALKMALRFREHMAARFPNDPSRRNEILDKSASDLSDIFVALDQPDKAEQYLQSALKAAEPTTDADPLRTLGLLAKLARLADAQDQTEKAQLAWQRVVDLGSATAKKLAAGELSAALYPEFEEDLSAAYAATEKQADGIGVFSQLLARHIAQRDVPAAIRTRITLGSLCTGLGQYDAALQHFQKAAQAQHQLQAGSSDEADLLSLIAAIYKAQGNDPQSKAKCDEAAEIYRKLIQQIDKAPHGGPLKSILLDQLQIVDQQAGRNKDAIAACEDLLALRRQLFGEKHRLTYDVKSNLGAVRSSAKLRKSETASQRRRGILARPQTRGSAAACSSA